MDTNTDDQVDQLGMITMLCLDAKHSMFGISKSVEVDIATLGKADEKNEEEVVNENSGILPAIHDAYYY